MGDLNQVELCAISGCILPGEHEISVSVIGDVKICDEHYKLVMPELKGYSIWKDPTNHSETGN